MAKHIIWSLKAQNDRMEILKYWKNRNKSSVYSKKLFVLFQEAIQIIAKHPEIGSLTEFDSIRSKVVRDYQIFYKASEDAIQILAIWDSRRDPEKLEGRFE